MNSLFRLISTSFIYCTLSLVVYAQSPVVSEQAILACAEKTRERTAALVAEDWPQLERLGKIYVQSCRNVVNADFLSSGFEHIAFANLKMLRFIDALDAANSCIETYYPNPGCHILKVRALIELDRIIEARVAFRIAERLVKHSLSVNERELLTARTPAERELYLAKKHHFEALLKWVEVLRKGYFIE